MELSLSPPKILPKKKKVPSQNALRLAACPEKRPGKRVCWFGVERWFFAFLMWFSAPPGPVYDVKLDAIPPCVFCFLPGKTAWLAEGSEAAGIDVHGVGWQQQQWKVTASKASWRARSCQQKLGTKTGCHDANLWTCLAFQHVAAARQNQASGQQLLAVDRALWQVLLSCDSLAKWDETIMTQCGLPNWIPPR